MAVETVMTTVARQKRWLQNEWKQLGFRTPVTLGGGERNTGAWIVHERGVKSVEPPPFHVLGNPVGLGSSVDKRHNGTAQTLSGKKMTKVIVLHGKAAGERSASEYQLDLVRRCDFEGMLLCFIHFPLGSHLVKAALEKLVEGEMACYMKQILFSRERLAKKIEEETHNSYLECEARQEVSVLEERSSPAVVMAVEAAKDCPDTFLVVDFGTSARGYFLCLHRQSLSLVRATHASGKTMSITVDFAAGWSRYRPDAHGNLIICGTATELHRVLLFDCIASVLQAYTSSSNGHYRKAYDGSSSNGEHKKAYGGSSNGQHNVFTKEKPKENPAERMRARYEIIGTHRPGEKEGLLVDQCRNCKKRGHWERHCKGVGCIVQVADFLQYHPHFCVQRIECENLKRICTKHPDLGIFRPLLWEYFQRLDELLYQASLGFELYRSVEEMPPGYDPYAATEEAWIKELKNEAKH
ncbi:hypothetical protein SELMODRAFT_424898 [Selaginella moellendorffii]|uniref:CCHC-type domain-containing protein n=1 Tax=Selaginella moellendorffii TaxID=88036 RepID=D8SRC9_SELML|nr:hypothetical protein SELMODRAFT_424898 [Selaginella moellendorffii]